VKFGTIVAAQARRVPDRVAVACAGERRTFGELDARSDRLARALLARGLRSGDRVVLYLGNGLPFVELFLAVLKAGGLVVPVTARLVGPELRYIVGDTRPFAIAFEGAARATVETARALAPEALRIVSGGEAGPGEARLADLVEAGEAEAPPRLPAAPDDMMIMYTSGTTGVPKGAIITHSNLITQTYMNVAEWKLTDADRFLATTPLAHRIGLARVTCGLLLGATSVVMPRFDAAAAARLIDAEGITVMGMVPTVARMLLDHLEGVPGGGESLRVALVTGEAFPLEVKRRLQARWPQVRMYSFFAMTEGGTVTSLGPTEQLSHGTTVGRPLPGVEVRIVDDKDQDVPTGDVGEILIRSGEPGRYTVMRGYYNRPDADAEAFVDGFFRTGDLGRFDADGYLSIVDRRKDMILSGGLNIYSKEVERALESHPAVAEAAVVGVPDARFGEAVCAYVIVERGAAVTAGELIEHCRALIAGYKKPRHVRFVDDLPRNGIGKVMKAELRARAAGPLP
jgi:acyl-CoA synthetase (AMP-forming)/AMP-acid ligase II